MTNDTASPLNVLGTPVEIINDFFGGKDKYEAALRELEDELFKKVNGN